MGLLPEWTAAVADTEILIGLPLQRQPSLVIG